MDIERTERTVRWRARPTTLLVGGALVVASAVVPAHAQDDAAKVGNAPTRAEFNKLQAEVRDQRQLIIQMLQNEQQRYDVLLRLIQGQTGGGAAAAAAVSELLLGLPVVVAPKKNATTDTKPPTHKNKTTQRN